MKLDLVAGSSNGSSSTWSDAEDDGTMAVLSCNAAATAGRIWVAVERTASSIERFAGEAQ